MQSTKISFKELFQSLGLSCQMHKENSMTKTIDKPIVEGKSNKSGAQRAMLDTFAIGF
jgi:hypothetical protein